MSSDDLIDLTVDSRNLFPQVIVDEWLPNEEESILFLFQQFQQYPPPPIPLYSTLQSPATVTSRWSPGIWLPSAPQNWTSCPSLHFQGISRCNQEVQISHPFSYSQTLSWWSNHTAYLGFWLLERDKACSWYPETMEGCLNLGQQSLYFTLSHTTLL